MDLRSLDSLSPVRLASGLRSSVGLGCCGSINVSLDVWMSVHDRRLPILVIYSVKGFIMLGQNLPVESTVK